MSNDNRSNAYQRELDLSLQEMLNKQVEVEAERVASGGVSQDSHAQLERAVMTMRRRLLPYANEPNVREMWEQASIESIPRFCAQLKREPAGRNEFGIPEQDDTTTQHAPVEHLEHWCDALVEIYSTLGFTPEAEHTQQQARGEYADILENASHGN